MKIAKCARFSWLIFFLIYGIEADMPFVGASINENKTKKGENFHHRSNLSFCHHRTTLMVAVAAVLVSQPGSN